MKTDLDTDPIEDDAWGAGWAAAIKFERAALLAILNKTIPYGGSAQTEAEAIKELAQRAGMNANVEVSHD